MSVSRHFFKYKTMVRQIARDEDAGSNKRIDGFNLQTDQRLLRNSSAEPLTRERPGCVSFVC